MIRFKRIVNTMLSRMDAKMGIIQVKFPVCRCSVPGKDFQLNKRLNPNMIPPTTTRSTPAIIIPLAIFSKFGVINSFYQDS